MTQRVIKFRIIYKGKINGYERLTYKDRHIFWEWMALDMNPDNGFERWTRGVYPANFEYIRNQFSGLPDKHGKELYEGDIVHCLGWAKGFNHEVVFYESRFCLHRADGGYTDYIMPRNIEIVGNIYTTPELIEK